MDLRELVKCRKKIRYRFFVFFNRISFNLGSSFVADTGCDSPRNSSSGAVAQQSHYPHYPSLNLPSVSLLSAQQLYFSDAGFLNQRLPTTSDEYCDQNRSGSTNISVDGEESAGDENSVNIDDVGYEASRDFRSTLTNYQYQQQQEPFHHYLGFPHQLPEVNVNCESDLNRGDSGHFSAFRSIHKDQDSSPDHTQGYLLVKDQRLPKSPIGEEENLSSASRRTEPSSGNMLEHKLPFNFLGPPLAALHSMTEMKSSMGGGAGGDSNNNSTSAPSMSSPNAGLTAQTMHGQANAPNPHGIDTILSRPPPVTSAGLSSLTAGECDHFFWDSIRFNCNSESLSLHQVLCRDFQLLQRPPAWPSISSRASSSTKTIS